MRGRNRTSGSVNNDISGLIAGGLGYLGGSTATSGGETSVGDGLKYGIKCDVNNNSQYCKDVKNYNRFQMIVTIISTIIGGILFLIGLYFLYKMYLSK